jgi:hypothetical protein
MIVLVMQQDSELKFLVIMSLSMSIVFVCDEFYEQFFEVSGMY